MVRILSLLVFAFVCISAQASKDTYVGQISISANDEQLKSFVEGSQFQRRKVSEMPADLRTVMGYHFYNGIIRNSYELEKIIWAYKTVPLAASIELLDGRKFTTFLGYMFVGYLYKEGDTSEAIEESEAFQKKSEQELNQKLAEQFVAGELTNQFSFHRSNYSWDPKPFGYLYNNGESGLSRLQPPILSERLEQQNIHRLTYWKIGEELHSLENAEIPSLHSGQQVIVTIKTERDGEQRLDSIQPVLPESLLLNISHEIELLQAASWALIAKSAPSVDEDTYLSQLSIVIQRLHYDLNFYKKDESRVLRLLGQAQQLKGLLALLRSPHAQKDSVTFTANLGIIHVLKGKKRGKLMTFSDAVEELDHDLDYVIREALSRLDYKCELFLISREYKDRY